MQVLKPEQGFLGIESSDSHLLNKTDTVTIIPFGLESTVSYGTGTKEGPQAIINASHQVELFDEDLWQEAYKNFKIETLAPFPIESSMEGALRQLEKLTADLLAAGKFPLIFGGEHSLTAGAIRAIVQQYPQVCILHFDAHADLRDGYNGQYFSHAAALRRCLDYPGVSVVSCGVRNISLEEIEFFEQNRHRIKIFWAKDLATWDLNEIVAQLGNEPVYLSFDLDGFDSSLMPATGTPEPGGLFWNDAIAIIRQALQDKLVVGADIVELAPKPHLHACSFLAAKLAYKILAYKFTR